MSAWIEKTKDFLLGHPDGPNGPDLPGGDTAPLDEPSHPGTTTGLPDPAGPSEIPVTPHPGEQDLPGVANPNLPNG